MLYRIRHMVPSRPHTYAYRKLFDSNFMLAQRSLQARNALSLTRSLRCASYFSKHTKLCPSTPKHPSTSFVSFKPKQSPLASLSPEQSIPPRSSQPSPSSPTSESPSLFAELFPEAAQKKGSLQTQREDTNRTVPPLPLPTIKELLEGVESYSPNHHSHSRATSKAASKDAYKHKKIAVLVLGLASKSLIECDFRRIAPKATHIDGWSGPGDILAGTLNWLRPGENID